MESLNAIKHKLRYHIGSEQIFHQLIRNCCYTEGMKDYFTLAQCWWLYDIIQTEIHDIVSKRDPDTYYIKFKVDKEKKAIIKMVDWKKNVLFEREIEWTTHPEGKMEFHIGFDGFRSIVCLPSEN